MLIPSNSAAANTAVLVFLIFSLIVGIVLLSAPEVPSSLNDLSSNVNRATNVKGKGATSTGKMRTIVPSAAPFVLPPTPPLTRAPVVAGNKKGRLYPIHGGLLSPPTLNATDVRVTNPVDHSSNELPKCDDKRFKDGTTFGSYQQRGYTSKEDVCLDSLNDADADFACVGMTGGHFAASYEADGSRVCRCGGLPLENGVCVVAKSMNFRYNDKYDPQVELNTMCDVTTAWEKGKFVDGRYIPPNCTLLDVNPRSIVKRFPNKLFFFDGDSHQQDKVWGFLAEMRNQRLFAIPTYTHQLGKDLRYEVSEYRDQLDLYYFGEIKFTPELRKCRTTTQGPCTVFIYRFDRGGDDYVRTAKSLMEHPPDFLIGGFISATYSNAWDAQFPTKQAWQDVIAGMKSPFSMAWTSFPKNSWFIIGNMTEWVNKLDFPQLKHHFALLDQPFYTALANSPKEQGMLTFALSWHDNCHFDKKPNIESGHFDSVSASELCIGPVPKILYRAIISLFSVEKK